MALRFSGFLLDPERYTLERNGNRIAVRPKVFDLLAYLAQNRHRIVRREELVEVLWGGTAVGPGSLSGLVNELRQALGESGRGPSSIRTVHGRGYQFVADVESGVDEILDRESRRRGLPPLPRIVVEALAARRGDEWQLVHAILDWAGHCRTAPTRSDGEGGACEAGRGDAAALLRVEPSGWSKRSELRRATGSGEDSPARDRTVS
jgi:DNA-binding winged helix-turn-helix (wHTH) protein